MASEGSVEEVIFRSMKLSLNYLEYWWIAHIQFGEWFVMSNHREVCFGMTLFVWNG